MSYKGEKYQIPQVSQESTPDFQSDSYRKRKVSQSVPKDVIEEKVRNGEKLEELITNDGYNISKKLDIDNNVSVGISKNIILISYLL